jgi:hypothetical protein
MSKNDITTASERLGTAVKEIDGLCFNLKRNIFILSKRIFEYDNQFKDDELKMELERQGIMKGTTYTDFKKIGSRSLFHKEEYQKKLPNSYSALNQLAFLKDDVLRKYINSGKINSSTTLEEAKELKSIKGNSSKTSDDVKTVLSLTCKTSVYNKNKLKLKRLKMEIKLNYPFLNVNGKID